ncbi:tRNA pseudouridine(38-40) synthase TruA [Neorhodopirellula pilleata]|uniref:tRNA pseudouridine synthase A n=1 Tax=Neorhodopirellula pilleata TaxID=2714738 RepID=A0A5C6AFQ9_9BACT|nr:tRNA pseudouridine(38-40) synthase TruA [Neorhodopirellula pilleata]TWT98804.1 tRNA pseudouridine synthase A [Neorhodopirellula pilleata]
MKSPRTFALTVAYDGTEYSGWQVQPGRKTIQDELEKAARPLAGCRPDEPSFRILGSGRTDAGVHALGQVARCMMPRWPASPQSLLLGINSKLPEDIRVVSIREAVDRFHPIADAIGKRYQYQIQFGGDRSPFDYRTWHRVVKPHDTGQLQRAAERLIGTHDFAAFQAAGAPRTSTVRTISWSRWRLADQHSAEKWIYEVEGNGFLYNMVRNLVGTMLEVARGRRPVEWIDEVIASRDRKQAGPTAPPHGLFLCRVDYPDELFLSSN